MSDQGELIDLGAQLKGLEVAGVKHFADLKTVINKCAQALKENALKHDHLLAKYRKLEQDCDALKARRAGGDAVGVEQPYVAVLIDAHSHKFVDDLVLDKASGGPKAAQLLLSSIKENLRMRALAAKDCRIAVQAYANLKSLSDDAHRNKLADSKPRSLAPFTSGFSRTDDCDFVDVQDEEIAQSKIRKRLKVCVADPSCKHIFLAAAGSALYVQAVQAATQQTGKITLVRGGLLDQRLMGLGLPEVAFLKVFRKSDSTKNNNNENGSRVCFDWQKGKCSRPHCKFEHPAMEINAKLLGQPDEVTRRSSTLPIINQNGLIPINGNNERLDLHMRPPTAEQWKVWHARIAIKKPCNDFNIRRACSKANCSYDHVFIEPDASYCMQYLLKETPCEEGSKCRVLECFKGHVCQKDGCEGNLSGCKFARKVHAVDLHVANWVKPFKIGEEVQGDVVQAGDDSLIDFND
ncbi:hypothetical protein BU23DRAFT_543336 [Bimuria novae-zelandiae CBS 107.79]|uniref:C3H1-type domain-containing protein n=1 Tax=Bimuria novae-zelandiae CBS 107.79 TaxID=1447943 RepID=A0A6A5UTQ3_9PLEO|nr:hypothetical protein BU23DRAFT_543336 [Bimuria novae-zelandiae CBS 107.79]